MSKATREFFDSIKNSKAGQEVGRAIGEMWTELKQMGRHGAHEMAAALFNGNAFVMYPRTRNGKEDQEHGLPQEAQQEQERQRGGMEM